MLANMPQQQLLAIALVAAFSLKNERSNLIVKLGFKEFILVQIFYRLWHWKFSLSTLATVNILKIRTVTRKRTNDKIQWWWSNGQ